MPTLHRHDVEDWFDDVSDRRSAVRSQAAGASARIARSEPFCRHLDSLGLQDAADYRRWCRTRELSARLKKTPLQRQYECLRSGWMENPSRAFGPLVPRSHVPRLTSRVDRLVRAAHGIASRLPAPGDDAHISEEWLARALIEQERGRLASDSDRLQRFAEIVSAVALAAASVGNLQRVFGASRRAKHAPPEAGLASPLWIVGVRRLVALPVATRPAFADGRWIDGPALWVQAAVRDPSPSLAVLMIRLVEGLVDDVTQPRLPMWWRYLLFRVAPQDLPTPHDLPTPRDLPEDRRVRLPHAFVSRATAPSAPDAARPVDDERFLAATTSALLAGVRLRDLSLPVELSRRGRARLQDAVRLNLSPTRTLTAARLLAAGVAPTRTLKIARSPLGTVLQSRAAQRDRERLLTWLAPRNRFPERRLETLARATRLPGQFAGRPLATLKSRTVLEAMRWLSQWEIDRMQRQPVAGQQLPAPRRWPRRTIERVVLAETGECFSFVKLQTAEALQEEGDAMNHCVGNYESLVAEGTLEIWSVRRRQHDRSLPSRRSRRSRPGGRSTRLVRCVTLSLAADRIVQCRGRTNRQPTATELAIVRQWASDRGLSPRLRWSSTRFPEPETD